MTASAVGGTLLAGGFDGALRLWKVHSGKENSQLPCQTAVFSLTCLTAGMPVVSAGNSDDFGEVILWNPASDKQSFQTAGHASDVLGIVCSPDESRFQASAKDRTVRNWDPARVADRRFEHRRANEHLDARNAGMPYGLPKVLGGDSGTWVPGNPVGNTRHWMKRAASLNLWPQVWHENNVMIVPPCHGTGKGGLAENASRW